MLNPAAELEDDSNSPEMSDPEFAMTRFGSVIGVQVSEEFVREGGDDSKTLPPDRV